MASRSISANTLRRAIHARAAQSEAAQEVSFGPAASVLFSEEADGTHGNFLPASYRRISAAPEWARRLQKSYTSSAQMPRARDRNRTELECAASSDALLMNIFCYPRITSRRSLCSLLNIDFGVRPEFGVRAGIPMARNEVDRTELDMRLGDLLVEAKLTEGNFGTASRERVRRYEALSDVFDENELPVCARGIAGYQLVRGALAAYATNSRYLVLCDARRSDLIEIHFRVLRAIRSFDLRSRMQLLSWQELSATLPSTVQTFLTAKYDIVPTEAYL